MAKTKLDFLRSVAGNTAAIQSTKPSSELNDRIHVKANGTQRCVLMYTSRAAKSGFALAHALADDRANYNGAVQPTHKASLRVAGLHCDLDCACEGDCNSVDSLRSVHLDFALLPTQRHFRLASSSFISFLCPPPSRATSTLHSPLSASFVLLAEVVVLLEYSVACLPALRPATRCYRRIGTLLSLSIGTRQHSTTTRLSAYASTVSSRRSPKLHHRSSPAVCSSPRSRRSRCSVRSTDSLGSSRHRNWLRTEPGAALTPPCSQ